MAREKPRKIVKESSGSWCLEGERCVCCAKERTAWYCYQGCKGDMCNKCTADPGGVVPFYCDRCTDEGRQGP